MFVIRLEKDCCIEGDIINTINERYSPQIVIVMNPDSATISCVSARRRKLRKSVTMSSDDVDSVFFKYRLLKAESARLIVINTYLNS